MPQTVCETVSDTVCETVSETVCDTVCETVCDTVCDTVGGGTLRDAQLGMRGVPTRRDRPDRM